MSEFNIEVQGGSSVRLPTRGKYCEKDIIVTAIGDSGSGTEEIENIIDASGVLESTEGTVTDKVEQLIHATDLFFKLYGINFYGKYDVERIEFYIDWVLTVDFQYARGLKFLKGIDATKLTTCRNMFVNCSALETIEMPFDVSKHNAYHMEAMFSGCISLVDVRFVKETIKGSIKIPSPVLSAESIQSIIDGLATVATAQTLTLHADVKAKLTAEQLATITGKNWNLA